MKRKSFLLIELIICMLLLTGTLFPLLRAHAAVLRAERQALEELQCIRASSLALVEVQAHLSHYSWELLEQGVQGTVPLSSEVECRFSTHRTSHAQERMLLRLHLELFAKEKRRHVENHFVVVTR